MIIVNVTNLVQWFTSAGQYVMAGVPSSLCYISTSFIAIPYMRLLFTPNHFFTTYCGKNLDIMQLAMSFSSFYHFSHLPAVLLDCLPRLCHLVTCGISYAPFALHPDQCMTFTNKKCKFNTLHLEQQHCKDKDVVESKCSVHCKWHKDKQVYRCS